MAKKRKATFTVTVQVYRDRAKEYRWRLRASNGRTLSDSGEGYTRKRDSVRAAIRVIALIKALDVRSVRVT